MAIRSTASRFRTPTPATPGAARARVLARAAPAAPQGGSWAARVAEHAAFVTARRRDAELRAARTPYDRGADDRGAHDRGSNHCGGDHGGVPGLGGVLPLQLLDAAGARRRGSRARARADGCARDPGAPPGTRGAPPGPPTRFDSFWESFGHAQPKRSTLT